MNLPIEAIGAGRQPIPASEWGPDPIAALGMFVAVFVVPAAVIAGLWLVSWAYDHCRDRGRAPAVLAAIVAGLPPAALAWGLVASSAVRQTMLEVFGFLLGLYIVLGLLALLSEHADEIRSRRRTRRLNQGRS